jgi:hypothetical protein
VSCADELFEALLVGQGHFVLPIANRRLPIAGLNGETPVDFTAFGNRKSAIGDSVIGLDQALAM